MAHQGPIIHTEKRKNDHSLETSIDYNILVVTPSLNMGGIGRHLSVFADEFVKKGHKVHLLSCLNLKDFYELNPDITVYRPAFKNTGSVINKLTYWPRLTLYIRQKIRKLQPDFVLVFGDLFNPFVLLAAIGTSTPVFVGDMTSPDYNYGWLHKRLKLALYPRSHGIVCQTKKAEAYKINEFKAPIRTLVLDNPIREVNVTDAPKEKIVIYVGRFAWEKAPRRLIKVFALIENKPEWRLVMAGDGPLQGKAQELAKALNIDDRVDFLGRVNDVDALYSKASIYVIPSVVEGFPNALGEAMVAGLPVLCFDDFPSDEIVTHGYDGIIVSNGDIKEMAKQIERLMDDEEERKRLGENAKKIRERLDKGRITTKLLTYIASQLGQQK